MKVHSVGAGPGHELSIYLPEAIDLMQALKRLSAFKPFQASTAVDANEAGAGKVLEIREKRL